MIDCNQLEGTSLLLDEKLQGELKGIFGKMETAVTLKAVVDMEEEKSKEMALFLKTAASLSDLLTLELYTPLEAEALEFDTKYLPATGLYKDGVYSGVSFHGVPGGREINSFVLAIYNLSGPGQEISRGLVKKIQKIKKPANIKVCVSLACHHCPAVVAASQRIAILNPLVEAQMLDANLYPALVERYGITRVPFVILNDETTFTGPRTIEELTGMLG